MSVPEDDRVPVLSRVGDTLERWLFAGWYPWFVRAIVALVVVLGVVHLLRYTTDLLTLSSGGAALLELVTSVAVTLFVLAGVVQMLVYFRGVRRRETAVATTAEQVEKSAEDVEKVATELEQVAKDPDAVDPETVEQQAKTAEETASKAKETAESVKKDLKQPDAEPSEGDGTADDDRN